jgi:hypothetical protein
MRWVAALLCLISITIFVYAPLHLYYHQHPQQHSLFRRGGGINNQYEAAYNFAQQITQILFRLKTEASSAGNQANDKDGQGSTSEMAQGVTKDKVKVAAISRVKNINRSDTKSMKDVQHVGNMKHGAENSSSKELASKAAEDDASVVDTDAEDKELGGDEHDATDGPGRRTKVSAKSMSSPVEDSENGGVRDEGDVEAHHSTASKGHRHHAKKLAAKDADGKDSKKHDSGEFCDV